MRSLDLFSGIGGFALGFERAGIETGAFCEVDPFCREWLAQEWPGLPIYPDVRTLDGGAAGYFDVVCGGFPCQDISAAGKGEGLEGARSGLWFEMRRIVSEVRPLWCVIENVPRLRTLGADRIYSDMAALGYTGWFFVVAARDVGAPQLRRRAWGIFFRLADAHRNALRQFEQWLPRGWSDGVRDEGEGIAGDDGGDEGMADAESELERAAADEADAIAAGWQAREESGGRGDDVADPEGRGLRTGGRAPGSSGHADLGDQAMADAAGGGCAGLGGCGEDGTAERGEAVADRDGGRRERLGLEDRSGIEREPGDQPDGRRGTWIDHRRPGKSTRVGDAHRARLEGHAGPDRVESEARAEPAAATGLLRYRWPAPPGEPQHAWEAPRTTSHLECRLGATADGLPGDMGSTLNKARLKAAGNSVIPQITEVIGRVLVRLTAWMQEAA